MRGRPMIYERQDKERYILRSVGPNEINERGKVPSDDWLWSCTTLTNTPPAPRKRPQ
jgi:hypothetical protein